MTAPACQPDLTYTPAAYRDRAGEPAIGGAPGVRMLSVPGQPMTTPEWTTEAECLFRKGRLIPVRGVCRVSRLAVCSRTGELRLPACHVLFLLMMFGQRVALFERTGRYRHRSRLDGRHGGRHM